MAFTLIFLFGNNNVFAELPNGSDATDFTLPEIPSDCNEANGWGPDFNLFSFLNQGKHVVIDFSATWCGPCWGYHQSGVLENLYDQYGPNGTNQIMVVYVEASASTSMDCLCDNCTSGSTEGNWVEGVNYPFLSPSGTDLSTISNDYSISYFPTLYGISANNFKVYEVGQASQNTWESWLFQSFDMDVQVANVSDALCGNDGSIELVTNLGFGSVSYSWSNGGSGEVLTDLGPGTYSVTATDSHGYAVVVDNIVIVGGTNSPIELSTISLDDVSCFGADDGYISIFASGSTGSYTYIWSNGGINSSIANLSPGNYSVTCSDASGCDATMDFTISSPEGIINVLSQDDATCYEENGVVYFTTWGGTLPYGYDIGDGPIYNNFISGLASGDYTATLTDANGCTDIQEFTINDIPPPSAAGESSNNLDCNNTTSTLSAQGSSEGADISYLWTTEDGNILGSNEAFEIAVDAAGTYELVVTDNNSNCETTFELVIEDIGIDVIAEATAEGDIDCDNPSVVITGNANIEGVTYSWTTDDGNIESGENISEVTVNAAGTYTLVTTDEASGCEGSVSVTIEASTDIPQVSINDPRTITCTESTIFIGGLVTGEPGDFTFSWSTDDGTIVSGATDLDVEVSSAGTYVLEVTSIASNCSSTSAVTVEAILSAPTGSISFVNGSDDNTLEFTGASDLETGSWAWDFGDGNTSTEQNPVYTWATAGTYIVCLTVDNDCGSNETCQEIPVGTVIPLTFNVVTNDVVCFGENNGAINLSPNGGDGQYTILWTGPNDFTATTLIINNLAPGTYSFVLSDGADVTTEGSLDIIEPASLDVTSESTDASTGSSDGSVDLTILGGTTPYSVLWDNGATTTNLVDVSAGDYSWTVTDANGCVASGVSIVEAASAVHTIESLVSYDLYPVPADNFVNLSLQFNKIEKTVLKIYSLNGTLLNTELLDSADSIEKTIDVSGLNNGVYILHIENESGVLPVKFTVVR